MQVIIILLILWYLCEKLEIIRNRRKLKRYRQYQLEQKQLATQEKERKKAEALATRQAEKERKDLERIRKEEIKQAEKEKRLNTQRKVASSERQYFEHRRRQIYDIIELLEDGQSGTTHGSKEWLKYEKQIMSFEKQLQAMQAKEIKLRSI
jgi:hypothetical protein